MPSLADTLTISRMILAPLLPLAAVAQAPWPFAVLMTCGLLTDVADGAVARARGTVSPRGAQLDSRADLLFYSAVLIGLTLLIPERMRSEWHLALVIALAYVVPIVAGWFKFGRLTSYHTWLARLSLLTLCGALLLWVTVNVRWPLQAATGVLVLSAIEELLLTLLLTSARDNVSHVFAVFPSPIATLTRCLPSRLHRTRPHDPAHGELRVRP